MKSDPNNETATFDGDVVDNYADAAAALNLSVPTLRRLVARGEIVATAISDRRKGITRRHRRQYLARKALGSSETNLPDTLVHRKNVAETTTDILRAADRGPVQS